MPFGPLKSQASVRFWKEGHKVNAQRAGGEDDTGTDRSTQKAKVKMWNDLFFILYLYYRILFGLRISSTHFCRNYSIRNFSHFQIPE